MGFIIIWLACGVGCYFIAQSKGRNAGAWAAAGVLCGVFALVICAVLPKKQTYIQQQGNVSPSSYGTPQYGAPPPPPQFGGPSEGRN
jgi:hypothetical protein